MPNRTLGMKQNPSNLKVSGRRGQQSLGQDWRGRHLQFSRPVGRFLLLPFVLPWAVRSVWVRSVRLGVKFGRRTADEQCLKALRLVTT